MQRLLVMRPGAIGDTLLTIPALAALGARFPNAPIHLLGNPAAARLTVLAGVVDRWTAFDAPIVTGLFEPNGPGAAAGLGPATLAVAWCADPDGVLRANLARLGADRVLVAPSRPLDGQRHVADHLIETLKPLGVADEHRAAVGTRFEIPTPLVHAATERLERLGLAERPWIAVHPGSGSPAKNWPATALAEVVDRLSATLGATPVILAGPADGAALGALLDALPARPPILCHVPLAELAALLHHADAYLGNDSGPTHLAAMLGLPTLALFGPTDPALWAPLGPRARVLRSEPLADLAPGRVLARLGELLREGGRRPEAPMSS